MKIKISSEDRSSLRFLLRWVVVAVISGIVGSSVLAGFRLAIVEAQGLLDSFGLPRVLVGVLGALLVGTLIYRFEPDASGEGVPSYITYLNRYGSKFPLGSTIAKLGASLVTFICYGSGGLAGPVGRVNAGILSLVLKKAGRRTAAICGMAATVGALLHAPIGGGVFAVEIIQKANMRYRDLFPAVLSSAVAVWVSRLAGWEPLLDIIPAEGRVPLAATGFLVLLALIVGIVGGFYTGLYGVVVRMFRRDQGRIVPKVMVGSAAAIILVQLVNPGLTGTAETVLEAIVSGRLDTIYGSLPTIIPVGVAAIVIMLVRTSSSFLTIGSGMSAGLMGPAVAIGLMTAFAFTRLLGVEAGTPEFFAYLATGFAGIMASSMNVPIGAAIMTLELFGPRFGLPAGIAAVVGFQINRHRTIYDFAIVGSGTDRYLHAPRDPFSP